MLMATWRGSRKAEADCGVGDRLAGVDERGVEENMSLLADGGESFTISFLWVLKMAGWNSGFGFTFLDFGPRVTRGGGTGVVEYEECVTVVCASMSFFDCAGFDTGRGGGGLGALAAATKDVTMARRAASH